MSARSVVTMVALAASVAACARQAPQPVYAPPPRALTIHAQQGQSQRQQDRDKADCQSMASSQAASSEGWANIFIGCMGGRGYRVE
jgi:hypothetical protein